MNHGTDHQRKTSVLIVSLEESLKMERTSKYGARSVTEPRNAGADGNWAGEARQRPIPQGQEGNKP